MTIVRERSPATDGGSLGRLRAVARPAGDHGPAFARLLAGKARLEGPCLAMMERQALGLLLSFGLDARDFTSNRFGINRLHQRVVWTEQRERILSPPLPEQEKRGPGTVLSRGDQNPRTAIQQCVEVKDDDFGPKPRNVVIERVTDWRGRPYLVTGVTDCAT